MRPHDLWACKIKCVSGYPHGFMNYGGLLTKNATTTEALLDALLQACEAPEDLRGEHGLLKGVTQRLVERARQAALTHHLGEAP